jgi:hypothetical protein
MTFAKTQIFQQESGYPIILRSTGAEKFTALTLERSGSGGDGYLAVAGSSETFVTGSLPGSIILVTRANTQTLHLGSGIGSAAAVQILGGTTTVTGEFAHNGNKLGFFGKTPVGRPSKPNTLADVVASLESLGLVA